MNAPPVVQMSADDFLFDPNYIESVTSGPVDNRSYLKTTHVTGNGVSCELVSGGSQVVG